MRQIIVCWSQKIWVTPYRFQFCNEKNLVETFLILAQRYLIIKLVFLAFIFWTSCCKRKLKNLFENSADLILGKSPFDNLMSSDSERVPILALFHPQCYFSRTWTFIFSIISVWQLIFLPVVISEFRGFQNMLSKKILT